MTDETESLAKKYISAVEAALKELKSNEYLSDSARDKSELIIDAAKRYMMDARYYLESGKKVTALASVSYAEGLLDALRMLELVSFDWRRMNGT
jgi:FAD synthetase